MKSEGGKTIYKLEKEVEAGEDKTLQKRKKREDRRMLKKGGRNSEGTLRRGRKIER